MLKLVEKFQSLSFPAQFVVGAIFGAIAGPGLLAFLSEYATYSYAIGSNIRPPLEGIPYLSATVAIASLILSLLAISIFVFTRWLLNRLVLYPINYIRDTFNILDEKLKLKTVRTGAVIDKSIDTIRSLGIKQAIPMIIFCAATFTGLIYLIQYPSFIFFGKAMSLNEAKVVFVYLAVVLFSLWRPIINWFVAISFAVLFYLFSFTILFDRDYYSKYLKYIKYGGSIPVSVQYRDTQNTDRLFLILRSRDYIFVKSNHDSDAIEVPLSNVRSITYGK